jgi:ABC-2 type transport system permease protein
MNSVWKKTLFDRRRALMWWSLGLVLLVAAVISIYPSVRSSPEIDEFTQRLPEGLKALIGERSLTSPVGYVQSRLFQLMVPLLLLVLAIGQGADAVAGEERRKTLDLLLANPLSRTRLVVEKFAAVVMQVLSVGAVLWIALAVLTPVFDARLGVMNLAAASLNATIFAVGFGAATLALSAMTGNKGLAVGVATSLGAAAYVWESITAIVPDLAGSAWLSPFHHYVASDPLVQGFDLPYLTIWVAATVALVVLGCLGFNRRDLAS